MMWFLVGLTGNIVLNQTKLLVKLNKPHLVTLSPNLVSRPSLFSLSRTHLRLKLVVTVSHSVAPSLRSLRQRQKQTEPASGPSGGGGGRLLVSAVSSVGQLPPPSVPGELSSILFFRLSVNFSVP
ncbi:uncharacterized protein DS421_1g05300 [Arachis hypogaea]|nr:uncharacterized protein DS421_1g05300 [Arachis hypogaea]